MNKLIGYSLKLVLSQLHPFGTKQQGFDRNVKRPFPLLTAGVTVKYSGWSKDLTEHSRHVPFPIVTRRPGSHGYLIAVSIDESSEIVSPRSISSGTTFTEHSDGGEVAITSRSLTLETTSCPETMNAIDLGEGGTT
ncbi:MAG: hypothetical protein R3C03_09630 [Pirellulaceae bacterium]